MNANIIYVKTSVKKVSTISLYICRETSLIFAGNNRNT